jgi:hypothetical protein
MSLPLRLDFERISIIEANSLDYQAACLRLGVVVLDHTRTKDDGTREYGTCGAFMISGRDLYAVTAGHVIKSGLD